MRIDLRLNQGLNMQELSVAKALKADNKAIQDLRS